MTLSSRLRQIADRVESGWLTMQKAVADLRAIATSLDAERSDGTKPAQSERVTGVPQSEARVSVTSPVVALDAPTLRALLEEALSLWSDAEDQIDDMRHPVGLGHWTAAMIYRTQSIIRIRRTLVGELTPDARGKLARVWAAMGEEEIKQELARWKPHT